MTLPSSGLDALRELIDALIPAHRAHRRAPSLEADAPQAVRELWSEIGESPALAPTGLHRDALAARVTEVFEEWGADRFRVGDFSTRTRWLFARADGVDLIREEDGDPDPEVWRLTARHPHPERLGRRYSEWFVDDLVARVPAERRATLWYGSPLDARPEELVAPSPRLRRLAPGLWTYDSPPERVLARLGATVLFARLADWVSFALEVEGEHRPWLRGPTTPALGLLRSETPQAVLAVLDPASEAPAEAPGVELTPAFARADVTNAGPERRPRMLPWPSRVGFLDGHPVWIYAPVDPYGSDDDIYVFHEVDQREAVQARLERLGATIHWAVGRDLDEG